MTKEILEPRLDIDDITYEVVGVTEDNQLKVKFTSGEFCDIIFNVYGIHFDENEDNAVMHYEYNIHEGTVAEGRLKDFEQTMGDWLVQTIIKSLEKNELIFKGGTDENRTDDTEQSGV